jgi:quinol monooxygenase YgiN
MLKSVFKLHIQADQEAKFLDVISKLITATRTEKGCVSYQLFRDTADPCAYAMIEEWVSLDALEAHKLATHFGEFMPQIASTLDRVPEGNRLSLVM